MAQTKQAVAQQCDCQVADAGLPMTEKTPEHAIFRQQAYNQPVHRAFPPINEGGMQQDQWGTTPVVKSAPRQAVALLDHDTRTSTRQEARLQTYP